ncbi:hypothetical protein WDV92_13120 [Pseudomonas syringae pv. atrofaciens]
MDKTTLNTQGREQIGQLLAHLRLATADFAHPAESRKVCWDVQHLRVLEPCSMLSSSPRVGTRWSGRSNALAKSRG